MLEWVPFFKGSRIYNREDHDRWVWNYKFRAKPGEVFFDEAETKFASKVRRGFVVIEPNVPAYKQYATNKQWPIERYEIVAEELTSSGIRVVQFLSPMPSYRLRAAEHVATPDFRRALAVLRRSELYIGAEGGLHHGAAAVGIPAVVLFGGWVPPEVLGYEAHTNLTGDSKAACGLWRPCAHCAQSMKAISVDEVLDAVAEHLSKQAG